MDELDIRARKIGWIAAAMGQESINRGDVRAESSQRNAEIRAKEARPSSYENARASETFDSTANIIS